MGLSSRMMVSPLLTPGLSAMSADAQGISRVCALPAVCAACKGPEELTKQPSLPSQLKLSGVKPHADAGSFISCWMHLSTMKQQRSKLNLHAVTLRNLMINVQAKCSTRVLHRFQESQPRT